MIKYSPKRMGRNDNAFCHFLPLINDDQSNTELDILNDVTQMYCQRYMQYLQYKMPAVFGRDTFRATYKHIKYNARERYNILSTIGRSIQGTGKINYMFASLCMNKDNTVNVDYFRKAMNEAVLISQFKTQEFIVPYRLENLITEDDWYNICMPIIWNYFGRSEVNCYICLQTLPENPESPEFTF